MKTHFFITIALILSTQALLAATISIKQDGTGDYITIQEGINASQNGDTVLVWPGIYYENVSLSGRSITLASLFLTSGDESYIHNTIIDGNHSSSCIIVNYGLEGLSVNGFTIQNGAGFGDDPVGGGVYCSNSTMQINDCVIRDNFARIAGGISCKQGSNMMLSGNTIYNNWSIIGGGGIHIVQNSTLVFDPVNRNNIYLNYSAWGSDIAKHVSCPDIDLYLDTFTVINPDEHYVICYDQYGYPVSGEINIDIQHQKIEAINADLYVNPETGSNQNSGLNPSNPLKTIAFAYKKIEPDTLDPKTIHLANGIYSPSNNMERFPINSRSYVNLVGESREGTILDANSISFLFKGNAYTKNYNVKNISFINGFGNYPSVSDDGGIYVFENDIINFDNILIEDCIGSGGPGIISYYCNISLNEVVLRNNKGSHPIVIGSSSEIPLSFNITNTIVSNNLPDSEPETGEGGGILIGADPTMPNSYIGTIKNLRFDNNTRIPDPFWGPGTSVFYVVNNAVVNLINSTVGHNVIQGETGVCLTVAEGATLDIYNSIFYGDSLYELALGEPSGSTYASTANISYSNIKGGENGIVNWLNENTLNWLDGNIDADPLWDTASATPYALPWNSPCVDAGTPMYEFGMEPPFIIQEDTVFSLVTLDYADTIPLPATDLAGNHRIVNGRIDMGAYEFQDTATQIAKQYLQDIQQTEINVWPNPFTYNAFISFETEKQCDVVVLVHDMQGRQTRKLMDARVSPGTFSLTWDATDDYGNTVNVGAYIVTLYIDDNKAASKKVVKKGKQ